MKDPIVNCYKSDISFDFKLFKDVEIPEFLTHQDAVRQYVGIWKIFLNLIINTDAKKVLEFGTREGYSTSMFSEFLRFTEGHLWSVDLVDHKISEEDIKKMDNVSFIKSDVFKLDWCLPIDILYIDDWHNSFHLYEELDRFAKYAKVVMIHDVCQEWQITTGIMNGVIQWCQKEFMPYTIYPLNACGLAVIEVEKWGKFYQ